jgi:hypothetical protein
MRRTKRGDVRGHARAVFSFLRHPNAKFFVEDPAFAENRGHGIGELAGAMKDWLLKRWSGKGAHTRRPFPTPHPGFFYGVQDYESTFTISGQRSTLKSLDYCLKNGERLTSANDHHNHRQYKRVFDNALPVFFPACDS